MKYLLLLVLLAGCSFPIDVDAPNKGITQAVRELPTVNLPPSLRQHNWDSRYGEGSCTHCTMVNLFRWQGQLAMANHWRRTYAGGETPDAIVGDPRDNLADKLEREHIRYAYTTHGDVDFLQWACDTRRGCAVTIRHGRHTVALVEFNDDYAGILDGNNERHIIWVPRDTLVAEWQAAGGWAVAVIYTPPPPLP